MNRFVKITLILLAILTTNGAYANKLESSSIVLDIINETQFNKYAAEIFINSQLNKLPVEKRNEKSLEAIREVLQKTWGVNYTKYETAELLSDIFSESDLLIIQKNIKIPAVRNAFIAYNSAFLNLA